MKSAQLRQENLFKVWTITQRTGSEAFENLEEIISKLFDGGMPDSKADRLRSMALSCKRYLNQDNSTHVVNDSTSNISSASPDHCRFFALSDPKEEQLMQSCLHSHLIECDRCQELRDLFLSLEEEIGKVSERCPMARFCPCLRQLRLGPDRSGFNYPEHTVHT